MLVVGGGNTGFQIAEELSAGREVHLSIGSRQKPLPQRILGRDLFWYLDKTGLIRKTRYTRIGRRLQANEDTLIVMSRRFMWGSPWECLVDYLPTENRPRRDDAQVKSGEATRAYRVLRQSSDLGVKISVLVD